MITATMIAGLVIFLCFFAVALMLANHASKPPLISWTILAMGLVYGLAWIAVLSSALAEPSSTYTYAVFKGRDNWLLHNMLVVVLAVGVGIGWIALARVAPTIRYKGYDIFSLPNRSLVRVAWLFLIGGAILRWLYVQAYGGFLAYDTYARLLRSGIHDIYNPWGFLQPFGGLLLMASYIFWAQLIDGKRGIANYVGFLLSFLASIYVLYSWLGRVEFVVYLGSFGLAWMYVSRIRSSKILWLSVLGSVGGVYIMFWMSAAFDLKPAESIAAFVSSEFAFPFIGFFAEWDYGEYLWRGFLELILAPMYLLPSSWDIHLVAESSELNTIVTLGSRVGEGDVYGGMPVDLLTLGLMQAHVLGVFIIGILFGLLIRLLQAFAEGIPSRGMSTIIFAYVALRIAFMGVFYSHPLHVVFSNFGFMVFIVAVWMAGVFAKMRWKTI